MNEPFDGKIMLGKNANCFTCYMCGITYPKAMWKGDVLRSHTICNPCAKDLNFIIGQTYEGDLVRNLIRMTRYHVEKMNKFI